MSRLVKRGALAIGLAAAAVSPLLGAPNLGRPATPAEIAAWDIDVRPDFKGLPAGSGSVMQGQDIWEAQCESCHGTFGESNEWFTPLAGGTTAADQKTGHVKSLAGPDVPQRTTLMKLSTVSTLFDYIRRAMPWTAPKSLSDDEVYAVTAYVLYLNDVVDDAFVLDQDTIREVQGRLPNRNGMSRKHGLWLASGKPDTANKACMRNCGDEANVTSSLPDYARDAHGNLADQNRTFGPVRGVQTVAPAPATDAATASSPAASALLLAQDNGCTGCHGVDEQILGPSFREVAKRYEGKPESIGKLTRTILQGGSGNWGEMPMPAQDHLDDAQADALAQWILDGAQ